VRLDQIPHERPDYVVAFATHLRAGQLSGARCPYAEQLQLELQCGGDGAVTLLERA
jgi:hypothetical protein